MVLYECVEYVHPRGKKMTENQFRDWILNHVDKDRNKKISNEELCAALKDLGLKRTWFTVKRAMFRTDFNGNQYIDLGEEMDALVKYAIKHWDIIEVNA